MSMRVDAICRNRTLLNFVCIRDGYRTSDVMKLDGMSERTPNATKSVANYLEFTVSALWNLETPS